jgi:hypothetical protein
VGNLLVILFECLVGRVVLGLPMLKMGNGGRVEQRQREGFHVFHIKIVPQELALGNKY